MAKRKIDADVTASAPPKPTEFEVSLDEFCCRLSLTERRSGLISVFHYRERKENRYRDLPSAYAARFEAYVNPQPNEGENQ
ncbi:hypothetical protein MF451_003819 [Salmonella enterica subsp. enterica serovar Saintpaul]|nr:hypothetical protein [Salmonella enterica subsp. enterica serovar Saintpaul]